ncbi:hypothetical protein [Aeromicrobium chenweiae]|uniref:Uncharacterized protein n=1 Tax=Aeromicrobium chenweiae TaxID=2079793 RepID=A0A2S0WLG8_9ACTN|nr:hypothetical protein [Aeromicrobium chenweiae]AWB92110.1 hypothetical protein C3E78_07810 [Aeromicrobium chenweiae]TGN32959.1 hypothetical protein E4L97_09785 [Aeromicrobium chenweiae]
MSDREFTATFFALRVGLVFAALLVMLAPALVLIVQGELLPTISDSWWTDARTVFVVGASAASCLLVVVRGDTLTEQTLLNLAGALGFIVASVACVPRAENGRPVAVYDPDVAQLNTFALGGLLIIGFLVWAVAARLPVEMRSWSWHVDGWPRRILTGALPAFLAVGAVAFVVARDALATRAHSPAAVAMFALLGLVAMLRTSRGVHFLQRIGDAPVERSLTSVRLDPGPDTAASLKRFDTLYTAVAVAMLAVDVIAVVLFLAVEKPGWLLFVEAALLILFMIFWAAQTREAWLELRRRAAHPG